MGFPVNRSLFYVVPLIVKIPNPAVTRGRRGDKGSLFLIGYFLFLLSYNSQLVLLPDRRVIFLSAFSMVI